MVSPLARKSLVKYLIEEGRGLERQQCILVGVSRSAVRYVVSKGKHDVELVSRIHQLTVHHSGYGYR